MRPTRAPYTNKDPASLCAGPNQANIQEGANRSYEEGRYEAARILYLHVKNYGRLASCLVHLHRFNEAVEAARKANTPQTWREVRAAPWPLHWTGDALGCLVPGSSAACWAASTARQCCWTSRVAMQQRCLGGWSLPCVLRLPLSLSRQVAAMLLHDNTFKLQRSIVCMRIDWHTLTGFKHSPYGSSVQCFQ